MSKYFEELFTLLLKQDRALKISALEVMNMLLGIFHNDLPQVLQNDIIKNISVFIKDEDFYLAQLSIDILINIVVANPKKSSEIDEVINNCISLAKSSLIQGPTIDKLTKLFTVIGQNDLCDTGAVVNSLMTNINKNSLHATSRCIAAVTNRVKSVMNPYIKKFIDSLSNSTESLVQQLSLLSLSELGKEIDLSSDKKVIETVIALFGSNDEDTKYNASIALGGIALGNINHYLPMVLELINEKKEYQYLLLNTLKEIIIHGNKETFEILKKQNIHKFLFDYTETPDENLRQIVAECIGKNSSLIIFTSKVNWPFTTSLSVRSSFWTAWPATTTTERTLLLSLTDTSVPSIPALMKLVPWLKPCSSLSAKTTSA